jgi:hypothetical protein
VPPSVRLMQARVKASLGSPPLQGMNMSLGTILLIVLVLLLLGALPAWPYSSGWGYYPSGGLGLVLIVLLILVVTGRL